MALGGYDPVVVEITGGSGSLVSMTVPAIEVAAIRVPMGLGGTPPQPVPEPASRPVVWPILGVGGLVVLAAAAAGWRRCLGTSVG